MSAPKNRVEHLCDAMEQIALDSMCRMTSSEEELWVRAHLEEGCPVCREASDRVQELFGELLLAAPPVQPPPSVKDRLMASLMVPVTDSSNENRSRDDSIQVWNQWTASERAFFTVPASEADWQETAIDGIQARVLRVDDDRDEVTMLVRMAAGTSYPKHRHGGDEHCYVLSGDLEAEDFQMAAGDFQFAPAGSVHAEQRTQSGCMLLLVSSRSDEILT